MSRLAICNYSRKVCSPPQTSEDELDAACGSKLFIRWKWRKTCSKRCSCLKDLSFLYPSLWHKIDRVLSRKSVWAFHSLSKVLTVKQEYLCRQIKKLKAVCKKFAEESCIFKTFCIDFCKRVRTNLQRTISNICYANKGFSNAFFVHS